MLSGLWLTPKVVVVGNYTAFPARLGTMVGSSILGLPELPELVGSSIARHQGGSTYPLRCSQHWLKASVASARGSGLQLK